MGGTQDPSVRIVARLASVFLVPLEWLADDAADWPPPLSADQQIIGMVREALAPYVGAAHLTDHERDLLAAYRNIREDSLRSLVLKLAIEAADVQRIVERPPAEQLARDLDEALRRVSKRKRSAS